jgi:DNA-binding Lrp family transcriptional regulator
VKLLEGAVARSPETPPPGAKSLAELRKELKISASTLARKLRILLAAGQVERILVLAPFKGGALRRTPFYRIRATHSQGPGVKS